MKMITEVINGTRPKAEFLAALGERWGTRSSLAVDRNYPHQWLIDNIPQIDPSGGVFTQEEYMKVCQILCPSVLQSTGKDVVVEGEVWPIGGAVIAARVVAARSLTIRGTSIPLFIREKVRFRKPEAHERVVRTKGRGKNESSLMELPSCGLRYWRNASDSPFNVFGVLEMAKPEMYRSGGRTKYKAQLFDSTTGKYGWCSKLKQLEVV